MCSYMSRSDPRGDRSPLVSDEEPSQSVTTGLETLSHHVSLGSCDGIDELGLYSIHDGAARTITLPEGADGFEDVGRVKQYYFDAGEQPLLIVAPLDL